MLLIKYIMNIRLSISLNFFNDHFHISQIHIFHYWLNTSVNGVLKIKILFEMCECKKSEIYKII